MKTVYSFDYDGGLYLGPVTLTDGDRSPLEPHVFLVPGNCAESAPPAPSDAQTVHWDGKAWSLRDIPTTIPEAPPEPHIPTVQEQLAQLDAANALTQRNLRETILLMAEAFKQVTGVVIDLGSFPVVKKVQDIEAQAAAVRAQL